MTRFLIISAGLGGWLLAAGLAFRLLGQGSAAVDDVEECRPLPEHAAAIQMAPRASAPPLMEVYVRPHPPDFKVGRWVQFRSYRTFLRDGIERVQFRGAETTTVNSEAIEWPRQRRAYQ
ncbi:MAG: hypothetical protein K1X75_06120 [Leptospirales bacterium]|nr:hypothetical protein [Leptospirales bacterium]